MFKRMIAPVLVIAAGMTGAYLRTVSLNTAFEPEIDLFHASSAGTALAILSLVVVLSSLAWALFGPKDGWNSIGEKSFAGRLPMLAAGLLILLAGLFFFFFSIVSLRSSAIVTGALAVVSGLAVLGISRVIPGRANEGSQVFIILPVFWSCFWLLMEYRAETINPEIGMFIYRVLAIVSCVVMFFQTAACFVKNGRVSRLAAAGWLTAYFSIIVLFADFPYFLNRMLQAKNFAGLASYAYLAGTLLFSFGNLPPSGGGGQSRADRPAHGPGEDEGRHPHRQYPGGCPAPVARPAHRCPH
jgi:hypothetical protein